MLAGVDTMDTARALAALGALMAAGTTQAAVMPVDWQALSRAYAAYATDPFLQRVVGEPRSTPEVRGASASDIPDLRGASPERRASLVHDYLLTRVARIMGMHKERLDAGASLSTLGFDSLMAVQVKNSIEEDLGVVVPMIRFLQGPSVDELAPAVLQALETASDAAPEPVAAGTEWDEGSL